jgi:hypothetical protein
MIPQDANKVDNELRFIRLKVERAHTGRCIGRASHKDYQQERFIRLRKEEEQLQSGSYSHSRKSFSASPPACLGRRAGDSCAGRQCS